MIKKTGFDINKVIVCVNKTTFVCQCKSKSKVVVPRQARATATSQRSLTLIIQVLIPIELTREVVVPGGHVLADRLQLLCDGDEAPAAILLQEVLVLVEINELRNLQRVVRAQLVE